MNAIFLFLLIFTAFFLIVLVLVQRGKGGGLAGAFGGLGGQSAFGTKAGDLFTRITIGVAAVWIVLCIIALRALGTHQTMIKTNSDGANQPPIQNSAPLVPEKTQPEGKQAPAPGAQKPAAENPAPATKQP
ncbi:MAG: preprotein translocase subunit SecG [Thermoguttaceae bacterium]